MTAQELARRLITLKLANAAWLSLWRKPKTEGQEIADFVVKFEKEDPPTARLVSISVNIRALVEQIAEVTRE